jgi:hypothetical protein
MNAVRQKNSIRWNAGCTPPDPPTQEGDMARESTEGARDRDGEDRTEPRRVIDPLGEARWEQVRGDEEGFRSGETTETHLDRRSAASPNTEDCGNDLTGGMGDPGGER